MPRQTAGSTQTLVLEPEEKPQLDVTSEFDRVVEAALNQNASDIHYDPLEDRLVVRFRIDGFLFDMFEYPAELTQKITAHIKVAADLDIAERRLPQDGRIEKRFSDRTVSLRVSTLPIVHGEKVVLRILETSKQILPLESLGFLPTQLAVFNSAIRKPNGMVLICGPTGSGKTTTLYSALNVLNSRAKNIVTIEDPVEYYLPGINQSSVRESAGATFATMLRSVLRQDPDVVMVGEIRDSETASIAVKAALAGRLLFSTLHTKRAAACVERLSDLGIERSLISAGLNIAVSQVLLRKICAECRVRTEYDRVAIEGVDTAGAVARGEAPSFSYGKGCPACHMTGYKGRAGLFELFEVTEAIAALIYSGASTAELEAEAANRGMRTLKEVGFALVNMGVTTPEEVLRVTTL